MTDWYLGTDGNTPADAIDFTTAVLHELAHGLGFAGSMRVSNGVGDVGLFNSGSPNPVRLVCRERRAALSDGHQPVSQPFGSARRGVAVGQRLVVRPPGVWRKWSAAEALCASRLAPGF